MTHLSLEELTDTRIYDKSFEVVHLQGASNSLVIKSDGQTSVYGIEGGKIEGPTPSGRLCISSRLSGSNSKELFDFVCLIEEENSDKTSVSIDVYEGKMLKTSKKYSQVATKAGLRNVWIDQSSG